MTLDVGTVRIVNLQSRWFIFGENVGYVPATRRNDHKDDVELLVILRVFVQLHMLQELGIHAPSISNMYEGGNAWLSMRRRARNGKTYARRKAPSAAAASSIPGMTRS